MAASLPSKIGRYEVIDQIGRGGMGIVYRGRDPRIGRMVAIKLLRMVDDEEVHERFLQEAQSAGKLKHENIVTIYDFGEHDGHPFIVMEFVEGITLADQIQSATSVTLTRKLQIAVLSLALDYAHNRGIVHRDVKPANVMIEQNGGLKILDFGIARVANSGLTQAGALMGTPNYMSPEQVRGQAVDRRSDIFAVGLICYELLSDRRAFPGDPMTVMLRISKDEPEPLAELCPDLDPEIIAIVEKAIQKEPDRRYQTLAAMAADIAVCRHRVGGETAGRASEWGPVTPTPTPLTPQRQPSRPSIDREALAKLRSSRIDALLQTAQSGFDAGDYAAAAEACEQAALMDPEEPRVLDLLERVRAAVSNRQTAAWLAEARGHLERTDLTAASQLVARALDAEPSSPQALALRSAIARAGQERQRREEIASALLRARSSLSEGKFDSVIRVASEILISDPSNDEAHRLTREALAAIEEQRKQQQLAREVKAAVDAQWDEFAKGRCQEAIDALARLPGQTVVTTALAQMRMEMAAREDRAREDADRRRRADADALALVARAREQFEHGDHQAAISALKAGSPHTLIRSALAEFTEALAVIQERARQAEDARRQDELSQTVRISAPAQPAPAPGVGLRDRGAAPGKAEGFERREERRSSSWALVAGITIGVVAIGGGLIYYFSRPHGLEGTTTPTIGTKSGVSTSSNVSTTPTAGGTPSTGAGPGPDASAEFVRVARVYLSQGDFAGAADQVAQGLNRVPGNADLTALGSDAIAGAKAHARQTREAANKARGTDRVQFNQGTKKEAAADAAAKKPDVLGAVRGYLDAAELYERSNQPLPAPQPAGGTSSVVQPTNQPTSQPAQPSQPVSTGNQPTPNPAPVVPPAITLPVNGAAPIGAGSGSTVLGPPPPPPAKPTPTEPIGMSDETRDSLISAWSQAYKGNSLPIMKALYPYFDEDSILRDKINYYRKEKYACTLTFNDWSASSLSQWNVRTTETCDVGTRAPSKRTYQSSIIFRKDSSGKWIIDKWIGW